MSDKKNSRADRKQARREQSCKDLGIPFVDNDGEINKAFQAQREKRHV